MWLSIVLIVGGLALFPLGIPLVGVGAWLFYKSRQQASASGPKPAPSGDPGTLPSAEEQWFHQVTRPNKQPESAAAPTTTKPQAPAAPDDHGTFHWRVPSSKERPDGSAEEDDYGVDVVGVTHYQDHLRQLEAQNRICTATLTPEDDNPHDPAAVRVDVAGRTVGYLARDEARDFRARLRRKRLGSSPTTCEAWLTGGGTRRDGTKRYIGVRLNIKQFDL